MEKKSKKHDEKKMEKLKDSGDKLNLLGKVLRDLEITDLSNRDRGDSKIVSKSNIGNKSSRKVNPDKSATNNKELREKKVVGVSASKIKTKNQEYELDSDDSSKKELKGHREKLHKEDKKRLEESKGKTALSVVKDLHKIKTVNKARAYSELQIKSKHDIEGICDRKRDENARRIAEKVRRIQEIPITEETRKADRYKNLRLPPGKDLRYIDTLERRKLLREKYTVKLKSSNKNVESKDSFKIDDCEHRNIEMKSEIFNRDTLKSPPKEILHMIETPKPRKSKEQTPIQRKPMIKTIRNNDHRVYKAVTFIDDRETTPLQIKMPNSRKCVETNTTRKVVRPDPFEVSLLQIPKEKHIKKKEKILRRLKKRTSSPTLASNHSSPQTEVAKWAPSSITQHTKPYYEAWVDTTLAAVTKCSEKDKLMFNNQNIIRTFKRALEIECRSPSLVYEKINDEKYMGRITVNRSK